MPAVPRSHAVHWRGRQNRHPGVPIPVSQPPLELQHSGQLLSVWQSHADRYIFRQLFLTVIDDNHRCFAPKWTKHHRSTLWHLVWECCCLTKPSSDNSIQKKLVSFYNQTKQTKTANKILNFQFISNNSHISSQSACLKCPLASVEKAVLHYCETQCSVCIHGICLFCGI